MNSIQIQYIIVFVILGAVIGWVIYKIIRKEDKQSPCGCCSLSKSCGKKNLVSNCRETGEKPLKKK